MGVAVGIVFALASLLVGFGLISKSSIDAIDQSATARTESRVRIGEQRRTELSVTTTTEASSLVDFTVKNTGQVSLGKFSTWDLLVQYYESDNTYHIFWLPYTTASSPGANEWTITGLYVDAATSAAEIFQPNMLDPGEEAVIRANLSPAPKDPANNVATIVSPNGVSVMTPF